MVNLDWFIQYNEAPFFQGWLADLQDFANQYNMDDLKRVYDLDEATGYQLDDIAKLVGLERPVRFVGDSGAWRRGLFREATWGGSGSSSVVGLDDLSFRKILKVHCSQLNAPTTLNNIYLFLINAFGDYDFEVIAENMEILIRLPSDLPANDVAIILTGIITPPQGVEVSYEIIT